ncbi:hypothetical protein ABTY61_28015 [Kitasatospora sp. NPDC096128]|uniref:hypothetical protein n=1 Tax=Kitasatospora sp. NPDC096128 TaxID=3155547 RepID=UPI00331EE93B
MSDSGFPADLLELQRRRYAAESEWAADPTDDKRFAFAAVSAELYAHEHWATVGNRHEMKLKQAARPAADASASAA